MELAIVLVIIGLIVGGVLVGRDLIRAAEIRNATALMDVVRVAYQTYRLKYDCLPGDCKNATRFFTDTEDGDGNKRISCQYSVATPNCSASVNEHVNALTQMEEAGWIPNEILAPGQSSVRTGLGDCMVNLFAEENLYGSGTRNYVRLYSPLTEDPWNRDCVTPADAQVMDQKRDDGSASTGAIRGRRFDYTGTYDECTDQQWDIGRRPFANYNTAVKTETCSLFMRVD